MSQDHQTADPAAKLADFIIVGFPKCGTSALVRAFSGLKGVQVDRWNGAVEAPYFLNERDPSRLLAARASAASSGIVGHKFSSYIYNVGAIQRIRKLAPQALLIVCVRDPMRALLSWREMHKTFANDRSITTHFVTETEEIRAFYSTASLEDYYHHFARNNLTYEHHIRRLIELTEDQRIAIVSQETLAAHRDETLAALAGLIGANPPAPSPESPRRHTAFADGASAEGLSAASQNEVNDQGKLLSGLLDELRSSSDAATRARFTVLADA